MGASFLITIDTEGDNLWALPTEIMTTNAGYLPRFQELCQQHNLKPAYLTDWEMVQSPAFVELGRDVLRRGVAEIGMHLHAWNTPPDFPLTPDDYRFQPFLIEYPEEQMHAKVRSMTTALEDTFGVNMVSHRAGRWSFDERYARLLVAAGYGVDCSVTPHVSWASTRGNPAGRGGTDFSRFPEAPYFLDLDDISRPGSSTLLELPMTILAPAYSPPARLVRRLAAKHPLGGRAADRFLPSRLWLRPDGRNREALLQILAIAREEGRPYVELMLHSSELMPGGSPTFPSARSIEALYNDLEALFATAARLGFEGKTLSEYYRAETAARPRAGSNS